MTKILKGKPVAESIIAQCAAKVSEKITEGGRAPKLVVISFSDDTSQASYLNGIAKKSAEAGVLFKNIEISNEESIDSIRQLIYDLNDDENVNGILLMRPFPDVFKDFESELCELINADKDVDSVKMTSLISSYVGTRGFNPCTAEAIIKMLDFYNIDIEGKHIVVIGRSLVVGKPLANMMLNRNATVTICHSKSQNINKITKSADIVVVATGRAKKFGAKYFSAKQTVIDAGIN